VRRGASPPKEAFTLIHFSGPEALTLRSNGPSREREIGHKQETAMKDAITEIKIRAEILHKRMQAQDATVRRQDCLSSLAREMGFPNWPAAKRALTGEATDEFGDLLFPKRCASHTNRWYKTYEEAAAIRHELGGYLLAFRRQFVVVDRYFIEDLGLDPDDPDWSVMAYDWPRGDGPSRARLYTKLVVPATLRNPDRVDQPGDQAAGAQQ
jgi:hypothetical protein